MNITNDSLTSDPRWQALHFGLSQLTEEQLSRILDHVQTGGRMVCDTYNYDPGSDSWCPLAIGLGVPAIAVAQSRSFTNETAKAFITDIGRRTCPSFTLNPISGTPGNYFRNNRVLDIVRLCEFIMAERSLGKQQVA